MNDSHNEQIFDSLLEEMLTNQHPPDLTEVIQQRLRQEVGAERFEQLRSGRWISPSTQPGLKSASAENARAVKGYGKRAVVQLMLSLAASTILAIALWNLWPQSQSQDSFVAERPPLSTPTVDAPKAVPLNSELASSTPSGMDSQRTAIELPLDNLPFDTKSIQPDVVSDRAVVAQHVAPLTDQEIIQWVDDQFARLWADRQLGTIQTVTNEELLARVNSLLADSNSPVTGKSAHELSNKLVQTATFADSWSDKITAYWLRGAASDQESTAASLRAYLAKQIVARRPWNEVLSSLVGSAPDHPEAALLTAFAGGDNHRLASRLGSVLLDEALACARCHDASDNGRVISTDQDQYWSLVAIFTGIDIKTSSDTGGTRRTLVDRQVDLFESTKSPNVFFDRPDGRLQAAHYRLPGGDNWRTVEGTKTPRESLAKWIASTTVTDQASVNLAWRLVFGRPLVAQHSALDDEGLTERRAILTKLAEQFRAHNRDMGQLVSWLVATRPFAAQVLDVDRTKWLAASDQEVKRWNQSVTNFASYASKPASRIRSLDSALVMVNAWSDTGADRRTMLAQPTPVPLQTPTPNAKATTKPENLAPTTYLVRSVEPTSTQKVFIKRLTSSKLSWTQQVDHVAGLVGEQPGNAHLHSTAQKLLDSKNGDRQAALFQLLQGALLCQESM